MSRNEHKGETMSQYRIVCTRQEPVCQPNNRAHIVAVGTGTPSGYEQIWTLSQVLTAMALGNTFYTQGAQSGKVAMVESYRCGYCGNGHIRSVADNVTDNNLDNLPRCA